MPKKKFGSGDGDGTVDAFHSEHARDIRIHQASNERNKPDYVVFVLDSLYLNHYDHTILYAHSLALDGSFFHLHQASNFQRNEFFRGEHPPTNVSHVQCVCM